jgi:hypothetical protein
LSDYLLFLLNTGSSRPSIRFPRVQTGWSEDGFPLLRRLGRSERWELGASLASIKRGLRNDSCPVHIPDAFHSWEKNACREKPPAASSEYLEFARRVVRREFYRGWDKTYDSFCESFVPEFSAREEKGMMASKWWSRSCSWKKFQAFVKNGKGTLPLRGWRLRFKSVPSVGKVRPMGIPSVDWDLLGPLHKTIYQHLTTREWLLRGPPTEARMTRVCKNEYQTSIDLVAATDGLKIEVAEAILGALLAKSTRIPGRIAQMAHESLRPIVTRSGKEVTHGQMMGTYLSFPLLCLQSYVAARWATRKDEASYLVNGDDVVISAGRPIRNEDYPEGLTINESKTMRSMRAVEINSTQFLKRNGKWKEVHGLRRGAYYPDVEGVIHMAAAVRKAGPRWQAAFIKGKLAREICPVQLGLDLKVKEVFTSWVKGRRTMYRTLPPARVYDSRFERLPDEPSYGDRFAFHCDLFEGGREVRKNSASSNLRWENLFRVRFTPKPVRHCTSGRIFGSNLTPPRYRDGIPSQPRSARMWCYSTRFDPVETGPRVSLKECEEEALLAFL